MMMVQYLLDTGVDGDVPGVDAPQTRFGDIVEPVALALDQEKRVTEQINALAALAREERLRQRAVHAVVHQGAGRGGRLDVRPAGVVERSKQNPLWAEDWLARERSGGGAEDPTAPAEAGGA